MRESTIPLEGGASGAVDVRAPDDRFECSCCKKPIAAKTSGSILGVTRRNVERVFVDTDGNVYCKSCYVKCLDRSIRSVKKNPDETRPRMIHNDGNYYQLLWRDRAL